VYIYDPMNEDFSKARCTPWMLMKILMRSDFVYIDRNNLHIYNLHKIGLRRNLVLTRVTMPVCRDQFPRNF
jgi:hypothetical protein